MRYIYYNSYRGCLGDPAGFDAENVERCYLPEVIIDGTTYNVNLPVGWTVNELVAAVNAIEPGKLSNTGSVIFSPGRAISSFEFVCSVVQFEETFGTGGSNGNRVSTPNTNYTFANSGQIIDGSYAITTFQDAGLSGFNNSDFTITGDATGNANGNAFIVNADYPPGEFYRQSATVVNNKEYRVKFFAISTNSANYDGIKPNIRVNIEDGATNVLQTFETGDMQRNNTSTWTEYKFDFIAKGATNEFVLTNNSPGGSGNDLAIDQITFEAIERTYLTATPRGEQIPVEIIKRITKAGVIEQLRAWSADGTTEYTIPDPDGKVLFTGPCFTSTASLDELNQADPVVPTIDVEQICMQDENGPFIRHTRYDPETGNVSSVVNTALDMQTGYSPTGTVVPCDSQRWVEQACLQNTVTLADRGIEIVKYQNPSTGAIVITYHEVDGTPIVLGANETVTVGACCDCPSEICYRENCIPNQQSVQTIISNGTNTYFDTVELIDTSGTTFSGLANSGDGNISSVTNFGGLAAGAGDPDVVVEYILDAPKDNVTSVGQYNNWGSVLDDGDGLQTLYSQVELLDSTGNVLATEQMVTLNSAARGTTPITNGPIDNVSRLRLTGMSQYSGNDPYGFREILLVTSFESNLVWSCGDERITAVVEGPQDSRFLVDDNTGIITDVGGPHTITFNSSTQFNGTILTDNPGAFSTLAVTNGTVVTITGSANGATFGLDAELVDRSGRIQSGVREYLPNGTVQIRNASTRAIVENVQQVPCIFEDACDQGVIIGNGCVAETETVVNPVLMNFDPGTSSGVTAVNGLGTVAAITPQNTNTVANYPGPFDTVDITYSSIDPNMTFIISTDQTGVITSTGFIPPLGFGVDGAGRSKTQSGVIVTVQELDGNNKNAHTSD